MKKRTSGKGLSGMATAELMREVRRRERSIDGLRRRRDRLLRRVAELDAKIRSMGGSSVAGVATGRKRAKNEMKLVDSLAATLKGKTMSVTDAAEAVQKDGYVTTSPSFRTIVNQALISSGRFKRVARGQYTAKD